jgi:peroxiredoxin
MLALATTLLAAAIATGPEPGATVPAFTLADQNGAMRTLASLMGPRGLVLLFFRSADW